MEKNKVQEADEFFNDLLLKHPAFIGFDGDKLYDDILEYAIKFAKLHVKLALEVAAERANLNLDGQEMGQRYFISAYDSCRVEQEFEVDKQSILNAYLEDNIK